MRRFRPSASMVVALVALLFSMTGAGFAAQHYLITSVKQISPKVRHELHGKRGPRGYPGVRGMRGEVGIQGATGPANVAPLSIGSSGVHVVGSQPTTVGAGETGTAVVVCPTGRAVLGGGFRPLTPTVGFYAVANGPTSSADVPPQDVPGNYEPGWIVTMSNSTGTSQTFTAYVVCDA